MLHSEIREAAYYLWLRAGCPRWLSDHFWFEAEKSFIEFSVVIFDAINEHSGMARCFRCGQYSTYVIGPISEPGFCIECYKKLPKINGQPVDGISVKQNGRFGQRKRNGIMTPESYPEYMRIVSERAYYLWQDAGQPLGLDKHFWNLAVQQIEDENQVYSDWSMIEEEKTAGQIKRRVGNARAEEPVVPV